LDADPWLLNTPRGTVDLRTGEERSHNQGDLLTKITGIAPDASCPTPIWDGFLARVTDNQGELVLRPAPLKLLRTPDFRLGNSLYFSLFLRYLSRLHRTNFYAACYAPADPFSKWLWQLELRFRFGEKTK
jgi:hypothetical protein